MSKGPTWCGILLLALAARIVLADSPTTLPVSLATVSIPPGGTAQLQIFLAAPQALISGGAVVDLDPAIFGDIIAADAYSATGDQIGTADIQGRHLDIEFGSKTGGIGRRPDLPVFSITVPVLTTAMPGAKFSLTLKPGTSKWVDAEGVLYSPTTAGGGFMVAGDVSVQKAGIGGGLLPAGATVEIDGGGFSNATTAQIDGVAIAAVQFINPQKINLTLGSAADLTFRRITVQNPGGAPVRFFPVLHGPYVARPSSGPLSTLQPIFPLELYPAADLGSFVVAPVGIALQNPGANAVNAIVESLSQFINGPTIMRTRVTLPAGASYVVSSADVGGMATQRAQLLVIPEAPIRIAVIPPTYFTAASAIPVPTTSVDVYLNGTASRADPVNLNWTIGAKGPITQVLAVIGNGLATPFTLSVATESGDPWLSASPSAGTACLAAPPFGAACTAPGLVTLSVDPSRFSVGTYRGTVTIAPQGFNPQPTVVPVTVNVFAVPTLLGDQTPLELRTSYAQLAIYRVPIASSADALNFTATATTRSGQNWLSVTPGQGQTPVTLQVKLDPAALNGTSDSGSIVVAGPNNSLTIPVSLATFSAPPTLLTTSPASLQFATQPSAAALPTQIINVSPIFDPFTIATQTADGGKWLSAVIRDGPGVPSIVVTVDPTGLGAGTYQGSITVSSAMATGPAQVPVTLFVWSGAPPPLTVNATNVSLTAAHGTGASQDVSVGTGSLPLSFSVSVSTSDGAPWLNAGQTAPGQGPFPTGPQTTPTSVTITADGTSLAPGIYTGTVTIAAPAGSVNAKSIPVTFTVTAAAPATSLTGIVPVVTAVLNAASQVNGNLAPGEIVTLLGQGIGPAVPAAGTVQVLFDGVAAPVLYAAATQVNAVVPDGITGPVSNVTVQYNGSAIPAGGYPVAISDPGIFTLSASGEGPAAAFNFDGSLNGTSNPAGRGSTIQLFVTGAGMTAVAKQPLPPLTVSIGGLDAIVTYAAAVRGVAGLSQVNAVVPQNTALGLVPIVATVGAAASQANVSIAVK